MVTKSNQNVCKRETGSVASESTVKKTMKTAEKVLDSTVAVMTGCVMNAK